MTENHLFKSKQAMFALHTSGRCEPAITNKTKKRLFLTTSMPCSFYVPVANGDLYWTPPVLTIMLLVANLAN